MDAMPDLVTDLHSSTMTTQLIVLPISQIKPFPRNPRRSPHPARERIKASIRENGLDHALAVTQRPGTADYVLTAGGNTRLEVLVELYAETRDPRFAQIPCALTSWPGDVEILLAHVRENDLRDELSFIDKARAVLECKALLDAERDEPLSQQALSEALMQHGYGLSQSMISQFTYAVERLLPVIPMALENGLGRPQVQRIRHLDRSASRLWASCGLDTELGYDEAFLTLCRRYDGLDWSFDDLEEALAVEIAEGADRGIQAVRLDLRSAVTAKDLDTSITEQGAVADSSASETEAACIIATAERAYSRGYNDPLPQERRASFAKCAQDAASSDLSAESIKARPGNHPLKSARARSWALALRLAKRFGLSELVISTPKEGMGYLLIDVPDAGLLAQTTVEEGNHVRAIWQHLAACCELARAPRERLLIHLTEHSLLGQHVFNDGIAAGGSLRHFFNETVDHEIWRAMDDKAWRDYVALMDAYRSTHVLAANLNVALWSEQ